MITCILKLTLGKDPDAGKDWRQEDRMRWLDGHHQLDGHEFEQAPAVGARQGSLARWGPWGCKMSDTTEWLNWYWNWRWFHSVFPYFPNYLSSCFFKTSGHFGWTIWTPLKRSVIKELLDEGERGAWKSWLKTQFKKQISWHLVSSLHDKLDVEQWKQWKTLFSWAPKSLWTVTAVMKLRDNCSLEEKLWQI